MVMRSIDVNEYKCVRVNKTMMYVLKEVSSYLHIISTHHKISKLAIRLYI